MNVDLMVPGADATGRVFLTWTPVEAQARVVNPTGSGPVAVTLRSAGAGGGVTFSTSRTAPGAPTLDLQLPVNGTPVPFFLAGEFGRPSVSLGDAVVEARRTGGQGVLATKPVTVRIRKDAQSLSAEERDRFVGALGTLNGGGSGRFRDFRDMHVDLASAEEHGNVGFLPWHRAYLLDLERELQAIDPSVTLPYWRFDHPAPKVFRREFMGVSNANGRVEFTAGHPFATWRTDGQLGITRIPGFAAGSTPPKPLSEEETIRLGGAKGNAAYKKFAAMESDPHGDAHMSFDSGFITAIQTAARDPLFFMLHANVDRLWAKWQWVRGRTSATNPRSFAPANPNRPGHHLEDTMWPWNGVTGGQRPPTAPGGPFPASPSTTAPGPTPTVGVMIDYQAVGGGAPLGFAYDDVPFEV